MLNMKRDNLVEEVKIENFVSSIPGKQKKLSDSYYDPATGRKITITSYIPCLENLDREQTILLLEELRCHLRLHLWKKDIHCRNTERGRISEQQRKDTTYLINYVLKPLKMMLFESVGTSFLVDADFIFRPNNLHLDDPQALLLHLYCYDSSPVDVDHSTAAILKDYLKEQLAELESQLGSLQEDESATSTVKPQEFLRYRCEVKREQIALFDEVCNTGHMLDADEQPFESLCEKEKTVTSKHGPQWYRLPELVSHIEQMRLCQASEEPYAGLNEKYDAWLEELNRRIESLLPHDLESSGNPAEERGCSQQIRFLNSFVNGGYLERTEELLYCWYLNDCFPFSMDLKKMYRIEKELRYQLNVLNDEEEDYKARGESELWLLRLCLREKQLKQIRGQIEKAESLVSTTPSKSDEGMTLS